MTWGLTVTDSGDVRANEGIALECPGEGGFTSMGYQIFRGEIWDGRDREVRGERLKGCTGYGAGPRDCRLTVYN